MLKTNIGYWNNVENTKNSFVPSLDTGLLAINHYDMNGSVFENGNYTLLNLSPIDALICSYKEEKLEDAKIANQLNEKLQELGIQRDYVIDEKFVQSRVNNINEMYNSFCKSYAYSAAYRESHPYRKG